MLINFFLHIPTLNSPNPLNNLKIPTLQSTIKNHPSTINNLVEPLSEREIEVVRLLAAGLSNLEIAHKLYLSPNTLKAHTQNIYDKLDVHSRVQAVNRARELGYL